MAGAATIWDQLVECVGHLHEPFRASEIVGWFRRHYPEVNEGSLRAHIQSATSNVADSSKHAGFTGRHPVIMRVGHGVYVRYAGTDRPVGPVTLSPGSGGAGDVIFIACSDRKADSARPVRDLYLGDLFRKGMAYAERQARPWYALSGKWGLLPPDEVVAPYDLFLGRQSASYRRAWGDWVVAQLESAEDSLRDFVVEVHASQSYVEAVREPLVRRRVALREPLRGLRQGEQLGWYGRHSLDVASSGADPEPASAPAPAEPSDTPVAPAEALRVVWGPNESGPFEYRWPDSTERFDMSWEVHVETRGKAYTVRHCLGRRRLRRHSVTFVNRAPEVEGVASDDNEVTRGLVSPLKGPDRKLVRHVAQVPEAYRSFDLVDHRQAIKAPYSRDAVAVKLAEDDVVGWASYALARQEVRVGLMPDEADPVANERIAPIFASTAAGNGRREDVVAALLTLGRSGLDDEWLGPSSFTPNAAANQLIAQDPFAFLLGVVFDQGIPAERAWQAPHELRLRLGHLDPARMVREEGAIHRAIGTPPKLHRFVEKMPAWIVGVARIVTRDYGGVAAAIWRGNPTARQVQQRLVAFPGIGQKKAAMAVEILKRDLGGPISDMHGSDVAYDVHVRRVFLRTRLAQFDDLDHMVQVARDANPDRSGEIDLPAWHVGRTWCRAGVPLCDSCPLGGVCPKDIEVVSNVRGV